MTTTTCGRLACASDALHVRDGCNRLDTTRFVDTHAPGGRAFTLFARVYIDPSERSRRPRPKALGVIGGLACRRAQATTCP